MSALMPKILVIDDQPQIRRALRSILSARDYTVILAENGEQGLDLAAEQQPDLIILDMAMPGMGGLEVCRELRAWYTGPILILSVHGEEHDKITALDFGADDYLTKPFATGELLARLRALLRRTEARGIAAPVITVGELEIDIARRLVTRAGEPISLTPIEYSILVYLAQHADRVVTSLQLIDEVWGDNALEDTQSLRVHISHLRKKIEHHPAVPQHIITEPGIGYRFSTT
ncbi:MAG: response regulator transcription factor [bacterium]